MRYYRCRCGKAEALSSMGVSPCQGCAACQTTLEESPDLHRVPEPHDEVVETVTTTHAGETVTKERRYCRRCIQTLPSATPAT